MDVFLILILLLLLFGGGWGYQGGWGGRYPAGTVGNPIGIIVIVLIVLLLFGLLGPRLGFYHW